LGRNVLCILFADDQGGQYGWRRVTKGRAPGYEDSKERKDIDHKGPCWLLAELSLYFTLSEMEAIAGFEWRGGVILTHV
jgi:hypothetical protein